jgi:hypothetical protein
MHFAGGVDPADVLFVLDHYNTGSIPTLLRRYGFKDVQGSGGNPSAKKVILPRIVPVLHPLLTQNFVNGLKFNHSIMDKVVLVSRAGGDGTKAMRLVNNQGDVEDLLQKKYGESFVVFRPAQSGIDEAIQLFQCARMVIGSHGGAMYHALWASREAKVVELIPVGGGGEYPMQGGTGSIPPFAHLAIYTNSYMNGQPFYRWYEVGGGINYDINIAKFAEWIDKIDLN